MAKVNITIQLDVPDGTDVSVEVDNPEPITKAGGPEAMKSGLSWMEEHTPANQQDLQRRLLERLYDEFQIVGRPPSSGGRPYLNFYAAPRFGGGRLGVLTLRTGRFYAVLDPALASEFEGAEATEGRYVTCYIRNDETIELAVNLIRRSLQERGWSG